MGFMGIMLLYGVVFVIIMIIIFIMMLTAFILSAILKKAASKKESSSLKKISNVLLVIGIMLSLPVIGVIVYITVFANFTEVILPDGETKLVRSSYVSQMKSFIDAPGEISLAELQKLLEKDETLVFYFDIDHRTILEHALETGDADILRLALSHGAVFDNARVYDEFWTIADNSIDFYLDSCIDRSITQDDIEIVKMMFEYNAGMQLKNTPEFYSNVFGKAVWRVLYNDECVTDTELEFISLFADNGFSEDEAFLLVDEIPSAFSPGHEHRCDPAKDENYDRLMKLIGR